MQPLITVSLIVFFFQNKKDVCNWQGHAVFSGWDNHPWKHFAQMIKC